MLQSLNLKTEEGEWVLRKDIADSFYRSIAANCLMGRADRFLILCDSNPEYKELACQAAAKACAIFPVSIYFYDFGRILEQVGKQDEAMLAFAEFLRRVGTAPIDSVMKFTLDGRNVDEAVKHARESLETPDFNAEDIPF